MKQVYGIAARYEKGSVIHHESRLRRVPQVFAGDEKRATALIDSLADRGAIITTKGKASAHSGGGASGKASAGPPPVETAEG